MYVSIAFTCNPDLIGADSICPKFDALSISQVSCVNRAIGLLLLKWSPFEK